MPVSSSLQAFLLMEAIKMISVSLLACHIIFHICLLVIKHIP